MIVAHSKRLVVELQPYLGRLPIFPLQRVQLFPKALLPLYVFAPRYRELTKACLERGGVMAVATLRTRPGEPLTAEEYAGRPAVRAIAGAGKIVAHRLNTDGTYNILLSGLSRVHIDTELPPERSFREVSAHMLCDRWPRDFDADAARQAMVVLTEKLSTLVPQGGEALRALCQVRRRPGKLADLLAAALIHEAQLRRKLLETSNVALRCEVVSAELARLVAQLQRHAGTDTN